MLSGARRVVNGGDLHVPQEAGCPPKAPSTGQLVMKEAASSARSVLVSSPPKRLQLGGNSHEAPGEGPGSGLLHGQDAKEDVGQPSTLQLTHERTQGIHKGGRCCVLCCL